VCMITNGTATAATKGQDMKLEESIKAMFDKIISNTSDADRVAKLELLREYYTNAGFRDHLHNMVWDINNR
jgi:hypothetical protein